MRWKFKPTGRMERILIPFSLGASMGSRAKMSRHRFEEIQQCLAFCSMHDGIASEDVSVHLSSLCHYHLSLNLFRTLKRGSVL